jgi:hypothetical protein
MNFSAQNPLFVKPQTVGGKFLGHCYHLAVGLLMNKANASKGNE